MRSQEFIAFAHDYGVYQRDHHPENSLRRRLEEPGGHPETTVDVYLLGGGNLILRGLKHSTKDVDPVLNDRRAFFAIVESLRDLGYEERGDVEAAYTQPGNSQSIVSSHSDR